MNAVIRTRPASTVRPASVVGMPAFQATMAWPLRSQPSSHERLASLIAAATADTLAAVEAEILALPALMPEAVLPYLAQSDLTSVSVASMVLLRMGARDAVATFLSRNASVQPWVAQFLAHQFSLVTAA